MGQSLAITYVHVVFSTKHREPFIQEPMMTDLHNYIGGICRELGCNPIRVGGYVDHVHILCMLSKKITLMKFVEEVKAHSSKWMKTKDPSLSNFYWQDGYGAFSVGPEDLDFLKRYIEQQAQHHQQITFQDEYRKILKENSLEFDERYVWG